MGMSSYVLDGEEEFWNKVDEIVRDSDAIEEANARAIKFAKDNWLVPHLSEDQIKDGVWEAIDEQWIKI